MKRHESQSMREGCREIARGQLCDGVGEVEEVSHSGEEMETGTKKSRKIRRIWAHRCVHYAPYYSSDTLGHTELSGRLSYMRVTSVWPVFLCEYHNVSNNPLCPHRSTREQYQPNYSPISIEPECHIRHIKQPRFVFSAYSEKCVTCIVKCQNECNLWC